MRLEILLVAILFFLFSNGLIAQYNGLNLNSDELSNIELKKHNLGSAQKFILALTNKRAKSVDNLVSVPVSKGISYKVSVYRIEKDVIYGKLLENGSLLELLIEDNVVSGKLIVSIEDNVAYRYESDSKGDLLAYRVDINSLICVNIQGGSANLGRDFDESPAKILTGPYKKTALEFESKPGSKNVVLFDHDGYELPAGTVWNGGRPYSAKPWSVSDDDLLIALGEAAEDFAPFDVNVTNMQSVFDAAEPSNRQRCVISLSKPFTSGGDGVAMVPSFGKKEDTPCWMWPKSSSSARYVGDVSAHEVGHTLGCRHQGGASGPYYTGHDIWCPIMGSVSSRYLSQWSKSDFPGASANQDDLKKITGFIPYRKDDHGNTNNDATVVKIMDGKVDPKENEGVISEQTDVDVFKFTTSGGYVELLIASTAIERPNLDLIVKLYDSSDKLIATAETGHKKEAIKKGVTLALSLEYGDYYVHVDGYGTGDPKKGWTDYSSLGTYALSGTIPEYPNSIEENTKGKLVIYPSPSNGLITIEGQPGEYLISNSIGQVVKRGTLNSVKETIDLTNLENGSYIFNLKGENKSFNQNFILKK